MSGGLCTQILTKMIWWLKKSSAYIDMLKYQKLDPQMWLEILQNII